MEAITAYNIKFATSIFNLKYEKNIYKKEINIKDENRFPFKHHFWQHVWLTIPFYYN